MKSLVPILIFFSLLFSSCAGTETVVEPDIETPVIEETVPEPVPEPEPEPVEEPAEQGFAVSQEVYEQTFVEIEDLIKELNRVISRRDYSRWLTYLSTNYKRTYNSTDSLNIINEYPQMKGNNIVLTDIKGYFDWVVVPSRSQAVLDDIVFVGETQVIAYTSFDGKRAKLYELERINGEWKITVW